HTHIFSPGNMWLTAQDFDTAADLIVRRRRHWKAPAWLTPLLKPGKGQALILEQIEEPTSKNMIEVVGDWQQSLSQPDMVRLCFSKKPEEAALPPAPFAFQSTRGTSEYLRKDSAGNLQRYTAKVWRREKAGVERRRQEAAFHCHILLRGGKTITALK